MQRMEQSTTSVLRQPLKNGISPYVVNNTSAATNSSKHSRCGLQSTNPNIATSDVGMKRQTRQQRASNNGDKKAGNSNLLLNKTMDSLNYWKRAFNQQEPAIAAIPERLVRVGGGISKKSMFTSTHVQMNKEDAILRRPKSPLPHGHRYLPKALLKTLSPIQNSPQFHNHHHDAGGMLMGSTPKKEWALEQAYYQPNNPHNNYPNTRKAKSELDSASTDLNCFPTASQQQQQENNPNGQSKKEHEYDDDLVFAIEI